MNDYNFYRDIGRYIRRFRIQWESHHGGTFMRLYIAMLIPWIRNILLTTCIEYDVVFTPGDNTNSIGSLALGANERSLR